MLDIGINRLSQSPMLVLRYVCLKGKDGRGGVRLAADYHVNRFTSGDAFPLGYRILYVYFNVVIVINWHQISNVTIYTQMTGYSTTSRCFM